MTTQQLDSVTETMKADNPETSSEQYECIVISQMLTMSDGVNLAVTYYKPKAKLEDETFPVILEMLPYRKDDFFYGCDYEYGAYFAQRGFAIASVDVRGTGGSEGFLPDREYSDAELKDAEEIIEQLAKLPWSNGKVGMYGISWSGFNSLMLAHRKPPALKAIIAAHATDDLFYNDVHYIDGVLHMDLYAQQIDSDNALPRSPHYLTDNQWIEQRFDREPWIFTWFRQQSDGEFWRRESLHFKTPLDVPAYLIGGLLDGYRDFVPRIFEHATAPVIAEIGPWNHAFPEYGEPGPNYEWRQRALRWWDHWLKDVPNDILKERRFMVFVRGVSEPSTQQKDEPPILGKDAPGSWRCEPTWPIAGMRWQRYYANGQNQLAGQPSTLEDEQTLDYLAGVGLAAGGWWGEITGDMSNDDKYSLVYDSDPIQEDLTIIGMPKVSLQVAAVDAPFFQWTVRLEDVSPEGKVYLISGALINPSQRNSRLVPEPLIPGQPVILSATIHFTSWCFKSGHRVRLAVANAQFPMAWPTPYRGKTKLILGSNTWLELPVPPPSYGPTPKLPIPEKSPKADDLVSTYKIGPIFNAIRDDETGQSSFTTTSSCTWKIGQEKTFNAVEFYEWQVNDATPAEAKFEGQRRHSFLLPENGLDMTTHVVIKSSVDSFTITFTRTLFKNGSLLRTKTWEDVIQRHYQ